MQQYSRKDLQEEVVKAKDRYNRQFKIFTENFYVMRAALRYFSVKQGMSFNSSKIADNFPLNVSVAGSCLKMLDELEVIQCRKESTSRNRYMPQKVEMGKMKKIEDILVESREIEEF